MSKIAHVFVILRGAGEIETVVAPDGVADHLHQRLHVLIEELREQTGAGIGHSHKGAGRGRIQPPLHAPIKLPAIEHEEIGALATGHVDNLDVFPRPNGVTLSGRAGDAKIHSGISQGLW